MTAFNAVGALAILAFAAACNTAEGVKKDADVAAEKTAEAAATTGNAMGGAMETGQIKTALMADSRVDASDINVDTNEDKKTVTLKGTVKTEAQKVIAGEIAKAKAASYLIMNELTIKP